MEGGVVVDGRYRIVRRLAVGGMAEIYQARAVGLEGFEKPVVIKRILPQYLGWPEFVGMFLDEARLAATLHHPNIAQVYDIGRDGDSYYFAMEHVAGRDVHRLRERSVALDQPVPLEIAVAIASGIAAGLHAAHEMRGPEGESLGIVHRDVSPSNVIVGWDGSVKLIDFGIAKARRRQTQTRTGVLKGKSCSMSPEQCLSRPVDRRSDIFSLGILLWELSTGVDLFARGSEYETMRRIVDGEVDRPSDVCDDFPPALEAIVMRALEYNPDDRYQTALDMQVALGDFARTEKLNTAPYAVAAYVGSLFPERDNAPATSVSPPLFLAEGEMGVTEAGVATVPDRPIDHAPFERAATVSIARGSDRSASNIPDAQRFGLRMLLPTADFAIPVLGSDDALDLLALDLDSGADHRDPTSIVRTASPEAVEALAALPARRRDRISPSALAALLIGAVAAVALGVMSQRGWLSRYAVASPVGAHVAATPIVTALVVEPVEPIEASEPSPIDPAFRPTPMIAPESDRPQNLRPPALRAPSGLGVSWAGE